MSIDYSGVHSVKKTTNFIVNYKCGDMFRLIESSSGELLNHDLGTSSESAHFLDLKLFTTVRERGYKWRWYYCYNNDYINPYPTAFPVRERYGSTLLPATREQHDQNCTQSH